MVLLGEIGSGDAVHDHVLRNAILEEITAQHAFTLQSSLLEYPSRGGIAWEMAGLNAVQLEVGEGPGIQGSNRFWHNPTTAPVSSTHVAKFTSGAFEFQADADFSDDLVCFSPSYGERMAPSPLCSDHALEPFFGPSFRLRVDKTGSEICHVRVVGNLLKRG